MVRGVPVNSKASVPINSESSVMTSLISRLSPHTYYLEGARRGWVCVNIWACM